jgi:ferredoxin-thioredoxin reductase catalytic subunit
MKNTPVVITDESVERRYLQVRRDAEQAGYALNPDTEFVKGLIKGLLINQQRYGYESCPCRLASGAQEADKDIICPCDYRDQDLAEHQACYCALYVSQKIITGERELSSIPERRLPLAQRGKRLMPAASGVQGLSLPVWRCTVCGYLCARTEPPEICPICKVKQERFERFI